MSQSIITMVDAIQFERDCVAVEIADLLIRAFGSPDVAEAVLERLMESETTLASRDLCDRVIIALAQMRG